MEIMRRFVQDLPHRWIELDDVWYAGQRIAEKEQLKSKLNSGNPEIPLSSKLRQLEEFILELARKARRLYGQPEAYFILKKEIKKFIEPPVETLYRRLFDHEEYFYDLAKGLELPDRVKDIIALTRENLREGFLCYDDAAALAFMKLRLNSARPYPDIKQVLVDEAQDYYPLHYEVLRLLFPDARYTLLGDINQTLEKQEDLSLYPQIAKILNKKTSSLITLDKSFRCTNEILAYSSKFIPQSMDIKSFNRKGREPEVYAADSQGALNDRIVAEVRACVEAGYRLIGLICKTEKNALSLMKGLKGRLDLNLIKNGDEAELSGVCVIPVYMSKGLEFDAVLVCDASHENYHSAEDKKLLYIACTRALHRLHLFCKGEVNPLL
jgi:DNA helicase-2/ATP-dependent DNA helicase PcrA